MNHNFHAKGIFKKKPLVGPKIFQIDLTKNCNLDCIGCWCHSDLLGDTKFSLSEKKEFISFSIIKKLLNDLYKLKTERIILAGPGEPLLHPNIKEIIIYIKKKGFFLEIITNFTIVSQSFIDLLIFNKVDQLTVSVWAGDAKTYVATHPRQKENIFFKLKENLISLNKQKQGYPIVRIYNVISSRNYKNIFEMINFSINTLSDSVEFQLIDTILGKTDYLNLPANAEKVIKKQFDKAKKINGFTKFKEKNRGSELQEFGRYFSSDLLLPYFSVSLINNEFRVKCKNNLTHVSLSYNHKFDSSIAYFDPYECVKCLFKSDCYINNINYSIFIPSLIILGYGSFMRRISSIKDNYDSSIIDEIPCYIGYIYAKSLVNGDIMPCCKADKVSLGNLYNKNFSSIWKSSNYKKFRYLAEKTNNKSKGVFNKIGCTKCCDNLGMILQADEELRHYKESLQEIEYNKIKKLFDLKKMKER